jgi:hypothetical protein
MLSWQTTECRGSFMFTSDLGALLTTKNKPEDEVNVIVYTEAMESIPLHISFGAVSLQ